MMVMMMMMYQGLVLIDTGSYLTSNAIREQIREWTSQPLHTAIWTHGHQDHIWGIDTWEAESDSKVRVVAHRAVVDRFTRYRNTAGYNTRINARQFEGETDGIEIPTNFRIPDVLYDNEITLTVGKEKFQLFHDRGETDDATWVWIPRSRVLVTGDFFIWYAPNAGNPQKVQRYAADWAAALRKMAALKPKILLPGHGVPILGEKRVQEALSNTAEYLESIVSQTVVLMNKVSVSQ
jgi:glyoxylase-like metal-dependent hydrolase (beta-lactamase superfamily II)